MPSIVPSPCVLNVFLHVGCCFVFFFPNSVLKNENLGAAFPTPQPPFFFSEEHKVLPPSEANKEPEHHDLGGALKPNPNTVPEPSPSQEEPQGAVTAAPLSHTAR